MSSIETLSALAAIDLKSGKRTDGSAARQELSKMTCQEVRFPRKSKRVLAMAGLDFVVSWDH
ncbi:hypothetical protein ACSBLW_11065 [Thioclava sp. FR2]|uniref:hypothetical protein n=1 Tax=Thioclava sp. FR2 TaxID=3445780 RepID=UPI003EC0C540